MTCSRAVRIGIALGRHTEKCDANAWEFRPRRTIQGAHAGACHVIQETGGE